MFAGARAAATRNVSENKQKQTSPHVMAGLWNKRVPGLIPQNIVLPEKLDGDTLHLEGQELVVVGVGRTDLDPTPGLYPPSVGLVVEAAFAQNYRRQYCSES